MLGDGPQFHLIIGGPTVKFILVPATYVLFSFQEGMNAVKKMFWNALETTEHLERDYYTKDSKTEKLTCNSALFFLPCSFPVTWNQTSYFSFFHPAALMR